MIRDSGIIEEKHLDWCLATLPTDFQILWMLELARVTSLAKTQTRSSGLRESNGRVRAED